MLRASRRSSGRAATASPKTSTCCGRTRPVDRTARGRDALRAHGDVALGVLVRDRDAVGARAAQPLAVAVGAVQMHRLAVPGTVGPPGQNGMKSKNSSMPSTASSRSIGSVVPGRELRVPAVHRESRSPAGAPRSRPCASVGPRPAGFVGARSHRARRRAGRALGEQVERAPAAGGGAASTNERPGRRARRRDDRRRPSDAAGRRAEQRSATVHVRARRHRRVDAGRARRVGERGAFAADARRRTPTDSSITGNLPAPARAAPGRCCRAC